MPLRAPRRARLLAATGGLVALLLAGCRSAPEPAPVLTVARVIELHADSLMAIPGVVGVAESLGRDGKPIVLIMLAERSPVLIRRLPRRLEGYPVKFEVTGPIRPMGN